MSEKQLVIPKVSRASLLDELVAAGFSPLTRDGYSRLNTTKDTVFLTVEEADETLARTVVTNHDASALDAAEVVARTKRQQVRDTIVAYPDIATPTNAQTVQAVKALCLAVRDLYHG